MVAYRYRHVFSASLLGVFTAKAIVATTVAFGYSAAEPGGERAADTVPVPIVIHVRDHGAIPDDGMDDAAAINKAIKAAEQAGAQKSEKTRSGPGNVDRLDDETNVTVLFEAGVYNLMDSGPHEAMINLRNVSGITLQGETGADGGPATVLEVNLELGNDVDARRHMDIFESRNIHIENFVMDHHPRFNTAGEVVEVDRSRGRVVVDIFPGLPHFSGMKVDSANSWDLETGDLLPVVPLTQGGGAERRGVVWEKISGGDGRRYAIENAAFADHVNPGEGISWHFNVHTPEGTPVGNNVRMFHNKNVSFQNIHVPSTIITTLMAAYNENIAFQDFRIEPKGESLAVGPRDGLHFSKNTGRLLVDNFYIKGVRWDPLVCRLVFVQVSGIEGDRRVKSTLQPRDAAGVKASKYVIFWVGDRPFEQQIESVERVTGSNDYLITFVERLPSTVQAGSRFTPEAWNWNEAIIRNSLFEGNFGTPIVYQSDNLLLENNIFRNNAYSAVELGPTSNNAGGFARNIVIRHNEFRESTWTTKGGTSHRRNDGTITTFNKHAGFHFEPYNTNILIENNLFSDIGNGDEITAIHLKNAQDVWIRENRYINVPSRHRIHPESTRNIVNYDE